jgi:hypothetical protein
MAKIRKSHRIEVKKVERSSDPQFCNGVKKQVESAQHSEATDKQSFFGVAIKNSSSGQAVKSDHKHDVLRGSVEKSNALCL